METSHQGSECSSVQLSGQSRVCCLWLDKLEDLFAVWRTQTLGSGSGVIHNLCTASKLNLQEHSGSLLSSSVLVHVCTSAMI
ncbi:hypothetical protein ILYODFUR_030763 [Ilyodon furcidens]|uniref:Uncharacterized protein n=1 Tax=Ilyodon furcidens TaxID=33524 RepID=A0ABV0VIJ8_9TELE